MSPVKRRIQQRKARIMAALMAAFLTLSAIMPVRAQAAAAKALDPSVDTVITNVGNYMLSVDTNPDYSSIWNVIGMIRGGRQLPSAYLDTFYNNTVNYLEENDWQITRAKYSDYSKLILAMTAIGKDARDISGHNLLEYLSDFSKVKLQGFNGPIWALIALNCHPDYEIPELSGAKEQTTEEGLIQYLLSRQITVTGKEGWTLTGTVPDTDITGMTIQALAPYYGKREDVTAAVDRALGWLSSAQNSSGGYSTLNGTGSVETSESDDQVIVALSAIGIDCRTDSRFITADGSCVMSRLFEYYSAVDPSKGGFMHVFAGAENNGGGAAGTIDGMATEQGLYAVVAYRRMLEGKTSLYDMGDIDLSSGEAAKPTTATTTVEKATTAASTQTGQSGQETTAKKIKVTKLSLNYKQITLNRGKTRTLKLKVTPSNATSKKVKWTSSNKKVATVSQKGKVKAVKTGKANITVTAQDGSGKKAVCKVIVKNPSSKGSSSGSGSGNYGSSGQNSQTAQQRNRSASGQQGAAANSQGTGSQSSTGNPLDTGSQGTGSQTSGSGTGGQTSGASESSGTPDGDAANASTEAGAWSFDGEAYAPESSGSSNGEADVWLADGSPFPEYDAGQESTAGETEGEYTGYTEDLSGPEETEGSDLPPWLAVLLGLVVPGGLAGSFKVPWQTVGDKMLLLAAMRKKE